MIFNRACYFFYELDEHEKIVFMLAAPHRSKAFKRILDVGPPRNQEKFKSIGDGIYELKTRGGVRILAFFGGELLERSIVLTHGFKKPQKRVLKREKEKALRWYRDYSNGYFEIK